MILDIEKAIKILKEGGIVIFPTDTAFGIGCRVDNVESVRRLFKIRKRPETQAMSILVDTVTMAKKYVTDIPKDVIDTLIEPYWPGALTIVLSANQKSVPSLVSGGGETVGVRIPNHPIARKLIRGLGAGILGPSANFHGEKTPYKFEDLDQNLISLVDYVIEAKRPGLAGTISTVIDCSIKPWKVVREGAIQIQNSKFKIQKYKSKVKNNIALLIDTSSNKEIMVGVGINGKEDIISRRITVQKAQVVLPLIDQLLKKHRLELSDISKIEVNCGPGSFTGIRVGISIANALSFALNIPINNKPIGEFVDPIY